MKKKRKKKDKRQWEKVDTEEEEKESSKPKKQKEEKETTVLTLRRSKEPKEGKERKERRTKGKGCRKESTTDLRNVAGGKTPEPTVASGAAQVPVKVPGKRGRKPKVKVLSPVIANQGSY